MTSLLAVMTHAIYCHQVKATFSSMNLLVKWRFQTNETILTRIIVILLKWVNSVDNNKSIIKFINGGLQIILLHHLGKCKFIF